MSNHATQQTTRVLLVEDDHSLREALADTLMIGGYDYLQAPDAETALSLLRQENVSMVISDVNMPGMDGHALLRNLRSNYPHLPVLLMTAYGTVQQAVTAIRDGAVDYLVKPFAPKALLDLVAQHAQGKLQSLPGEGPVAVEPASLQLLDLARRVAASDSTVLVSGESGTGKEVLARYIHQHSPRAKQPFVAINCAAIPENMLEGMLFGHEKGAFTGAYNSAPGKFEQANGGTLLLDEISEMDIGLQAKLLRVIQEREVERLGGRKPIPLDVRILATTNRHLAQEVKSGNFREDLFYRLSVFPLYWQPLRERPLDIVPIAQKLLASHVRKMGRVPVSFDDKAEQALKSHQWPGNVRELDNVVQRALIMQPGNVISDCHLRLDPFADSLAMSVAQSPSPASLTSVTPLQGEEASVLGNDLQQREFEIILSTLRHENGSRKNTAEKLGISPRTLRYKIARMRDSGINPEEILRAS